MGQDEDIIHATIELSKKQFRFIWLLGHSFHHIIYVESGVDMGNISHIRRARRMSGSGFRSAISGTMSIRKPIRFSPFIPHMVGH